MLRAATWCKKGGEWKLLGKLFVPKTLSRNVVPAESVSALRDIITGAVSGVQS